jgi:hypothetical protein
LFVDSVFSNLHNAAPRALKITIIGWEIKVIYKAQSNKVVRKALRIIFLIAGIVLVIFATLFSWLIIFPGFYLIVMVFFIKDKEIIVHNDRFELHRKSVVPFFSDKEVFNYGDIKKINYDPSFTNIKSELIGNAVWAPGTSSKPDTIEVFKFDDSFRVINRIGDRQDFENAFKAILEMYKMNNSR